MRYKLQILFIEKILTKIIIYQNSKSIKFYDYDLILSFPASIRN